MLSPTQIQSFVTAIAEGSISSAARKLGLTQPAVSQHLSALEAATGQTLVTRSSRGVQTTAAGDIVLQHGRQILREFTDLQDNLDLYAGEVSGTITVSTNVMLNRLIMLPIFARVVTDFPRLTLRLAPTDTFVDLDRDGIDMALRAGEPGTGTGVVRRIADIDTVLVACPDYLAKVEMPQTPAALADLNFIQYRDDPDQTHMDLRINGEVAAVPVSPAFAAQNADLLMHALTTGLGFARVPRFAVAADIADGRLIEILPDTPPEPKPIFLIQNPHAVDLARNRVLRHLMFEAFDGMDHAALSASAARELQAGLDPSLSPS